MLSTRSGSAYETNFHTQLKMVEKLTKIYWKSLLTTTNWFLYHIGMRRLRQRKAPRWRTCKALQIQASSIMKHLTRTWMPRSLLYLNQQWNSSKVFRSQESHPLLWLMPPFWNPQLQLKSVKHQYRILKERSQLNSSEMHKKSSRKSALSNRKLIQAASRIKRSLGRSAGIALLNQNLKFRSKEIKLRPSKRSTKFKSIVPFNHNLAIELHQHIVDDLSTQ